MILCKLPVAMSVISGIATSAMAADLPKEGTFSGTYTAVGTYKTIKVGDRALSTADEMGLQVTNGVADHMTFHCWAPAKSSMGKPQETANALRWTRLAILLKGNSRTTCTK
jgi:hypothetical protein